MAPRKTRNGATATARRSSAAGGSRASSSSGTRRSGSSAKGASRTSAAGKRSKASRSPRASSSRAPARKAQPFRWWVIPAAAALLLAVFAWTYYPVARVQYRETREKARLEYELSALKARNGRLREQVDRLRTPQGVEDYARSELGLVKRGEHVAVVVDGDEAAEASATLATPRIDGNAAPDAPVGPWTAFLDLVFGEQ